MSVQVQAGGSLRTPMSFQEYQALGETLHTEYYDGLCVANPPSLRHVLVARRITRALEDSAPPDFDVLPEAGWLPEPESIYVPDVMVARRQRSGPDDLLRTALLVVVEVTSRSTRSDDRGRKMSAYADGGAGWYWLVDPEARDVTVHRNRNGRFHQEARLASGKHSLREPFPVDLDLTAIFA